MMCSKSSVSRSRVFITMGETTKYNNIKTGVLNYISECKIKNYQIDAIGITLQPKLKIEHLKNI